MTDCITDEIWEEAMQGVMEYEKSIADKKTQFKRELKNLLNVKKLWQYMDDHDSWEAVGIFEVSIYQQHNYYYGKVMPHLKIHDEQHSSLQLHRASCCKMDTGTSHYFVIQWNPCEDCYHGYLAFPLRNRRYFLVSYSA